MLPLWLRLIQLIVNVLFVLGVTYFVNYFDLFNLYVILVLFWVLNLQIQIREEVKKNNLLALDKSYKNIYEDILKKNG